MIGKSVLENFWIHLCKTNRALVDIAEEIFSETRRPTHTTMFLTIPRIVGYFISATPGSMPRNGVLSISFRDSDDMDLARVLINSNVFYWYWRAFGDGFHLNVDLLNFFPIPKVGSAGYHTLAARLDDVLEDCSSFKMFQGRKIPNYNFNKRMDILLDIDDWIVRQVAPELDLPRDIFAQYKSNSFLRPLDLSALVANDEAHVEVDG